MRMLQLFLASACLLCAAPAFAATLVIGIDESSSNPIVLNKINAQVTARYVRGQVAALKPGDFVEIRTFADRSSAHVDSRRVRIDRMNRSEQVADRIAQFVASLPSQSLHGQDETNILAFLEFTRFDPSARILLLTDGREASAMISEREFLGGKRLPSPDPDILKGREVVMLGLGQTTDGSLPPQIVMHMRKAWSEFMQTAGAKFDVIINP